METHDDVDLAAVVFWLTLSGRSKFGRRLQPIKHLAEGAVAGRVGNLPKAAKEKLYEVLRKRPEFAGKGGARLKKFITRADAMKTPWWKSLLGLG